MGARIGGYCSDFSRTLSLRAQRSNLKADKTLQQIHNIVLKAQLAAIEGIKSGMDGAQADGLARDVIEQAGYGDAFGHSLGHGVGLAVHESPILASNSTDCLLDGMVFTIEPGIYILGWGGVRIEDMVILEEGKARVLTKSEKNSFQLSVLSNQKADG
jgi:Xaa-Pro aminopeptidase